MLGLAISIMLACRPADHVWSLEECISCALGNSPGLRQEQLSLRQCRNEAALQLLDWLPAVNVYAGNDFSWGRSVDMQELMIIDNRMNYTASASAALSLSISDKAARLYDRRAGQLQCRVAEAGLKQTEAQLIADVTAAYLQLLLTNQACDIALRNYEDILDKLDRTRTEVDAGHSAIHALESIKAQAAGEKSALTEAESRKKLAIAALYHCMNLPPEEDIEILPPVEDCFTIPDRKQLAGMLCMSPCPERDAAQAALERDEALLKAARWALVPELNLSCGYGTYYGRSASQAFAKQLRSNGNPSLSISLNIPVLNGSVTLNKLGNSKTAVEKDKLELQKVMTDAEDRAWTDATETVNLYEVWCAAKDKYEAMANTYATTELGFSQGRITPGEYLLARNNVRRAEAECLQAKYRYLLQLKIIEYRYEIRLDGGIK